VRAKPRPIVILPAEQIPIEQRIDQLMARLSESEACGFEDLFSDVESRAGMIVTFLALLEMIRLKLVRVFQAGVVGPIRIYKRARPADAPSFGRAQDGPEPVEGPKPIGDVSHRTIESPAERPIGSREDAEQPAPLGADKPLDR
jgi:hypothetical protein